ncbi:MAG: hypothetical protein HY459_02965 [Parcubacteria group bacterium]|nr:hypothetical protein [Parcubacteria group bacterium]
MRKAILPQLLTALGVLFALIPLSTSAQMPAPYRTEGSGMGMMGNPFLGEDDHTAQEEAKGKAVWERFTSQAVACDALSDEDFAALGEYFMGQMLGEVHPSMNAMMIRAMGGEGEEAMHVAMGKRISGCEAEAPYPAKASSFMSMMNMMMNGWGSGGFMMGGNYLGSSSLLSSTWITRIFVWALLAVGIAVGLRWLSKNK